MSTTTRSRPGPGLVLLLLAVAATAGALLLDLRVPASHREALSIEPGWTGGVPGVVLAWAGAVVLAQQPRHPVGWVLGVFGAWWALDGLAASWLMYATLEQPALTGASTAHFVYQRLGAWLLLVIPLLLLLYPDGRLPTGRWRAVATAGLAATTLLPLTLVAVPARVAEGGSVDAIPAPLRGLDLDPLRLPFPDDAWAVLLRVAFLALAVSLVPVLAVVVHRYRIAAGTERRRMRWLLWAAVVDALVMVTLQLLPDQLGSWGLVLAVVVTSAAVVVGITRPDLVDVDRLLGGTLLYAVLLLATFLLDLLVLGAAGRVLGDRLDNDQALVVAVLVVALAYAPLRHRLSRLVRRWVVGERDDPYAVVSELAERLEDSTAGDAQLLVVARSVADAFRVRYVGVELRQPGGETVLAEHGSRPERARPLPITYRGEQIGTLLLPRDGVARLRASDERLLADVVRQAAAAARADRLASELQQSRERLVAAVEDERRRLRRDLHDGLGPTLAAVASRIDVARITAARAPEQADEALAAARHEVSGMLAEVRRLVHGLRPPALDDVGLVRAVRQQANQLSSPALVVEVEADGDLDGLPAAVEVACFRIVSEALTNVVRHADASRCSVRLSRAPEQVEVEVADDGTGIEGSTRAGVGLLSLRERAEELGGRCEVTGLEPHGTRVRAALPLPASTLAATVVEGT
ncbi:MAG TPA: sensor histidine kinase [Marmoricola sp.]|nr:sensor histidine kinase [Marmoricola sp.]